jgi:hypothetical protein
MCQPQGLGDGHRSDDSKAQERGWIRRQWRTVCTKSSQYSMIILVGVERLRVAGAVNCMNCPSPQHHAWDPFAFDHRVTRCPSQLSLARKRYWYEWRSDTGRSIQWVWANLMCHARWTRSLDSNEQVFWSMFDKSSKARRKEGGKLFLKGYALLRSAQCDRCFTTRRQGREGRC